jgi:ArsR family transcriptional regulator, virulence genes transcriptional regulator
MIELQDRAEEVAEVLAAMANANRLMVMCHLLEGELAVHELLERVPLAQSAMSQHLGKLRALRLVATRRKAQTIYYRLASPEVARLLGLLKELYCDLPEGAAISC